MDNKDGGWRMEVRVQGKNGPVVKNVADMLAQVRQQLQQQQSQWLEQLRDNPSGFADLEMAVHQTFQRLADQTVAGLLAQVTAQDGFAKDQKKSNC
jgi:predicted ArsR family transcriptional regulator